MKLTWNYVKHQVAKKCSSATKYSGTCTINIECILVVSLETGFYLKGPTLLSDQSGVGTQNEQTKDCGDMTQEQRTTSASPAEVGVVLRTEQLFYRPLS